MAYKTLIFGVDDMFNELKPFYDAEVQRGNLEIVAFAVLEQNGIRFVTPDGKSCGGGVNFDLTIISSRNDFYNRMKFLEAQGVPRNRIIDGRVFKVPNLDFPRLLKEGIAYGLLNKHSFPIETGWCRFTVYPRVYTTPDKNSLIHLGVKSCINGAVFDGADGAVIVGKYSQISWSETFGFYYSGSTGHRHERLSIFDLRCFDWEIPKNVLFNASKKQSQIFIGNDVWIGRGCNLKCTNPDKPLIVGDGAVIASDSVVVKNVPPYAIVGGNPAQIIKYRFPPDVIESLLRIKWWDWSLDKIHDNFKYFNDIDRFIALHDK